MDDSTDRSRMGGTIMPGNLGDIAIASIRRRAQESPRYELRDPFAEVTYRTTNLNDIVAKAEKLGSDRFTEVDQLGRRTPVRKVDGQWQRGLQSPTPAQRVAEPVNQHDEVPDRAAADTRPERGIDASAKDQPADTRISARLEAQAEQAALVRRLNMELADRYVVKVGPTWWGGAHLTEYRFRGNLQRVAFTEARYRLATDSNNPSIARSMVDVAQAREWHGLRVSGHDDFRRMVWLEASLRDIRATGYEPLPSDLELLRQERAARMLNRLEPVATTESPASAAKASARGSGTRKTVLAAIEAVLASQRVPEKRREAIMAAAEENLKRRLAAGEVHKVKVYDRAAPPQRAPVQPTLEPQRGRERGAPMR